MHISRERIARLSSENPQNDQSMFAWESTSDRDLDRGLLAEFPTDFAGSGFFCQM